MTMKIVPVVAVLLGCLAAGQATAGIKCWKNHEGVRECGTSVPPEFAQGGHKVLNNMGMEVDATARAKTQAELEAEAEAKHQQEVEAEREKEAERLAAEQRRKDQILLQTFTSEKEIAHSRDEKIAVIDNNIGITHSRLEKLRVNLRKLRKNAAREEKTAKGVSEKLRHDIANVDGQIKKNKRYIADREQEKAGLQAEYGAMIQRFTELKAEQKKVAAH